MLSRNLTKKSLTLHQVLRFDDKLKVKGEKCIILPMIHYFSELFQQVFDIIQKVQSTLIFVAFGNLYRQRYRVP
jgi:hypothetical protein